MQSLERLLGNYQIPKMFHQYLPHQLHFQQYREEVNNIYWGFASPSRSENWDH